MRGTAVAVCLFALTATAAAHPRHHKSHPHKHATRAHERVAVAAAIAVPHEAVHGQSIGAPWAGHLQDPARLPEGDGYVIRRPWRSYGTRTTVGYIERAITEVRDRFPAMHVLAIGDISAEHGGQITEHHSHQSGRDADIGLVYTHQPAGYPRSFVHADAGNLDVAATYELVEAFAETAHDDGGVQMMFLDFRLQGLLYHWALDHGVSRDHLDWLFQYPHGRGSSDGVVRHEPNHDNHLHVRFRCARADSDCR